MAKVNDFASELTSRYGLSAEEADGFVAMMFDVMREELNAPDRQVKVKGLGTFKVTSVGARASVDVNTGERIILEGRNKISFTPEVLLRDRVNRPFVQFETVVLNDGVDFSDIDREFDENRKAETAESAESADIDNADEEVDETPEADDIVEEQETSAISTVETELRADEVPAAGESLDVANVANNAVETLEPETQVDSPADVAETASIVEPLDSNEAVDITDVADSGMQAVQIDAVETVIPNNPVGSEENNTVDSEENNPIGSEEKSEELAGSEDVHADTENTHTDSEKEAVGLDDTARSDASVGADNVPIVCKQRNPRVMYWLTAASFALLVCIGIGMYFLYRQMDAKNEALEQLQTRLAVHAEKAPAVDAATAKPAPVRQAKPVAEKQPMAQNASETAEAHNDETKAASAKTDVLKPSAQKEGKTPVEKRVEAEQKTTPKEAKPATPATPDYTKDVRIRTGAYVIVGTDRVVTVRKGQTLASISKANLGPGMECYVEAYNNVKAVNAGDKLKIPKLKLKKRQ